MSEVLSENELRDRIMLLGHELIDAEHFLKYANEIIESHKALQRRVEEHAEEIAKLQQALIGSMDANFKLMEAGCNKLTPPHEARG